MGPSLARRVRRACAAAGVRHRVLAASRFSDPAVPAALAQDGIEPLACDLLDPEQVARLPQRRQRPLPGRTEVRLHRPPRPHLGPQRDRAHARGPALRGRAHRRLLQRQRVPAVPARVGGRDGNGRDRPRRRIRAVLPGPRARVRVLLARAAARPASSSGCSTPWTCATARSWTSRATSSPESRWMCRWAASTRSGRATRTRTPSEPSPSAPRPRGRWW